MESLASRIAQLPLASASGEWQRHVAARHTNEALAGRASAGRWGTKDSFPVLCLGRPRDSVVVEAYRHIVDPLDFDDEHQKQQFIDNLVPRVLVTCQVDVTNLLDLRQARARADVGLTPQELASPTNDATAYQRCRTIAQIAHQLGRHGIIAPAATQLGETLALFMDVLPPAERPQRCKADEPWVRLPDDPRAQRQQLRLISGSKKPTRRA